MPPRLEPASAADSAALELLAGLVLEDGRAWGEVAAPFQWGDAEAIAEGSGARMHYLTRPRGGSKSTDVAGLGLALLLTDAPARSRSYVVAVDGDQAALVLDALAGFVDRTPGLGGAVEVQARRVLARATGASLEVLSADAASAWGLRPWLLLIDEHAAWPDTRNHRRLWEALVSSVPKVPGCRLVVLTSAGEPGSWPHAVLEGAKGSARWRVSETPGPLPWMDQAELDEQRRLLLPSAFARLHLNQWTAAEDRLATVDDVRACVAHEGPLPPAPGVRYAVAVDLGVKSDRSVLTVAHLEHVPGGDPVVVVDRQEAWTPRPGAPVDLGVVEAAIEQAAVSYLAEAVFDPWQSVGMMQRLQARRVRCREFTFSSSSVGRLALTLYRLLASRRLRLPDDEDLVAELAAVRLREGSPGVYRLDHDHGAHDDRAVSLALAAHHLLERPHSGRGGLRG